MDSAYDRFASLLAEYNLKPVDITRLTGISSTVLTEWKKGKSMPKTDKLILIARVLNTSVEYIVTGNGMRIGIIQPADMPNWTKNTDKLGSAINVTRKFDATRAQNADEMELLQGYRAASAPVRKIMLDAARDALKGDSERSSLSDGEGIA